MILCPIPLARWRTCVVLAALALVACGGADDPAPTAGASPTPPPTASPEITPTPTVTAGAQITPTPSEVRVVTGAPSFEASPSIALLTAPGAVSGVASAGGALYVGASAGLYKAGGGALEAVEVYDPAGIIQETGPVHALTGRESGLFVAAEAGFFNVQGWALVPSPLSATLDAAGVRGMAAVGDGAGETLWLASAEGLFEVAGGGVFKITLPGIGGAPTAVAASPARVIVAYPGALVDLDPEGWTFRAEPITAVRGVGMSEAGVAWVASEGGAWRSEAPGVWDHLLLAEGGSGAAASALQVEAGGGALVATAQGVARIVGDDIVGVAPLDAGATALGVTAGGDIWAALPEGIAVVLLAEPIRFADAVSPIFAARCGYCHAEGAAAPKHDFSRYEEVEPMVDDLLTRVFSGQMPADGPLSDEEYDVILAWDASGRMP